MAECHVVGCSFTACMALSSNRELNDTLLGVCRSIQRLLLQYEESREPQGLDSLIYQVDRLYRILLACSACSTDVLEAVSTSLALLQDADNTRSWSGYVSQLLTENRTGRPRLDIQQDQLEYLLYMGFSCTRVAEVLGCSVRTI